MYGYEEDCLYGGKLMKDAKDGSIVCPQPTPYVVC